jgi:hypothetical protein
MAKSMKRPAELVRHAQDSVLGAFQEEQPLALATVLDKVASTTIPESAVSLAVSRLVSTGTLHFTPDHRLELTPH